MKFRNKISKVANINLVVYAGVLPWGSALANVQMALMAVFFLLILLRYPSLLTFKKNEVFSFFLFIGYFLICLLSLIYTENLERGVVSLVRKLPLVVFPSYLLFISVIDKKWIQRSLIVFSFSVLLISFLSLGSALWNNYKSLNSQSWEVFTGANLSESLLATHKLYFALYIVLAILFLGNLLLKTKNVKKRAILILSTSFLTLFLFLLGTRTAIITVLLLIFVLASSMLLKEKRFISYIFFLFGICFLTTIGISYNPILKDRFKEAINYNNEYGISKQWGGTAIRKLIWKYAFEVVEKNPLLGVGLGDAQHELNKSYMNCKESPALKGKNYNSHSEPIQILVNTGVIGLIFFYGFQIRLVQIQKKKNKLLIIFLLVFSLCGLTESYLERDMGIRVYSFFCVMLFLLRKPNESTSGSQ